MTRLRRLFEALLAIPGVVLLAIAAYVLLAAVLIALPGGLLLLPYAWRRWFKGWFEQVSKPEPKLNTPVLPHVPGAGSPATPADYRRFS